MSLKIKSSKYAEPKDRIVLALDVPTKEEALAIVRELKEYVGTFKIGLQLFMNEGFDVVKAVQDEGVEIFFDVKLHDIPNTVAQASRAITSRGIGFFNIHSLGSEEMMRASAQAAKETASSCGFADPTILGVTLLTSIGQETLSEELLIKNNVLDMTISLAKLAKKSGLDGVVASVHEVSAIKQACGEDFITLCPGIRSAFANKNDQRRIATPSQAIEAGADLMVIGRAVSEAENRVGAIKQIYREINEAVCARFL